MLDVTSAITTTTTQRPARPVNDGARSESRQSAGQTSPVDGTALPVETAPKAAILELPELERLAESLTDFARSLNRDLSFSIHEASGHTVVRVLDGETKEVIRQIPSEEFLRLSESLAASSAVILDTEA